MANLPIMARRTRASSKRALPPKKHRRNDKKSAYFRLPSITRLSSITLSVARWGTSKLAARLPQKPTGQPGNTWIGGFPHDSSDSSDARTQMTRWLSTSQKDDYMVCTGIDGVNHWAHKDDVKDGTTCFTCAKSGSKVGDRNKRLFADAASLLETLRFSLIQPCKEEQFTTAFQDAFRFNPVVLKPGTNLLVDRIPVGHVCDLEENRFTQIPTVTGTLAEVVLIICYYYQERVKALGNATELEALSIQGVFKLNDDNYGCMLLRE